MRSPLFSVPSSLVSDLILSFVIPLNIIFNCGRRSMIGSVNVIPGAAFISVNAVFNTVGLASMPIILSNFIMVFQILSSSRSFNLASVSRLENLLFRASTHFRPLAALSLFISPFFSYTLCSSSCVPLS